MTEGLRRAWGWVAALRDGATTPWSQFTGAGEPNGPYLPGAQQLELLRRINLTGRPTTELVERVLTASAPGRGRPDLQLVGVADDSRFGPRPVDPGDLPAAELTRVATSLIAEDLVAAGPPPPRPAARPRPWRRQYRLVGDPWLTDPVRAELVRRGRPPGGRRATVLVVGADLGTLLVHAWTTRAFDEGGRSWPEWLAGAASNDRVPPRAHLVAAARTWSARVGRRRVEIVLDRERLPALLGVRRALPAAPVYSADAVELARRVSAPLGLLVLPERRAELLRGTLGPWLADAPGRPLGIPAEHAAWVKARAERMRDVLLRAGYAVHGDPDALVPDAPHEHTVEGTTPDDAGVLALAVRLLTETRTTQTREVPR